MNMELLLASRNPFYREGVAVILKRIFHECNVHQAATVNNIEEELNKNTIDLILIDRRITQSKPLEDTLISLQHLRPEIPICMLAESTSSKSQIRAAFELGIKGYFHSGSSAEDIKRTINMAISGRVTFPDSVWRMEKKQEGKYSLLTVRQIEIMKYIEKGESNKAIASALNLSVATVKRHISNIFKALGSKNRVEAINRLKSMESVLLD